MTSCAELSDHCIDSSEVIALNIRSTIRTCIAAVCMTILILDSRTGIIGASEGIDICLKTLIPSLFPFFILSIILTGALLGQPLRFLRPVTKICRIPSGTETLMAIGFLGGYPVGAQNVSFAFERGVLSKKDAERMVVFCNNAGPAFIFGFLGQMFEHPICPWLLWIIHIFSALTVGLLIPGVYEETSYEMHPRNIAISDALTRSIYVMAQVCGWVVLFRVILQFLRKWIFIILPINSQIVITGFLELANGCLQLQNLPSDGMKLVLSASMLGFGGMCVYLQTQSVAGSLSLRRYLPGKILQGCISFLVSYAVQFAFVPEMRCTFSPLFLLIVLIPAIFTIMYLRNNEKPVAISFKILYNKKSCEKRRILCCSGKRSKNPVSTVPVAPN